MTSLLIRFNQKYVIDKTTNCWVWTGYRDRAGYGRFGVGGKQFGAHRVSYELFVGPIPTGWGVLHSCDNPPCVNPQHLFSGTHQDNIDDKMNKGRHTCVKGVMNGRAKLVEKQVLEIRSSRKYYGYQSDLARKFDVCNVTISNIINRISWRHI